MTTAAASTTHTLTVPDIGQVDLTVDSCGEGQPFLVLHGGAGPQSMARFSQLLAEAGHNQVLTPTHPGWGGTPRPDGLASIYTGSPAMADPTLLRRLDDVTVPTLVLWGDSDQIVEAEYGRAYAAAIRSARFHLLPGTGHMPQMETPELVLKALWSTAD